jgi:hypothetical protein
MAYILEYSEYLSSSDCPYFTTKNKCVVQLRKTCNINPPPLTASHGQIVNEGHDVFAGGGEVIFGLLTRVHRAQIGGKRS